MAAFFGVDELNAQGFIDKSIVCIPHNADGGLDLHSVVSPIRNKDIVFIKHCTSDSSLHIKAVGVVRSEYLIEGSLGVCLPVTWVWQGDKVPVNVDEVAAICGEQIYEEHNIMVQREIIDLLREDHSWRISDSAELLRIPRAYPPKKKENITMSTSFYDIPVRKIDGSDATLNEHKGEVLLVVNVASKCGLTPQYEGLEKLYKKYVGRKFSVLGFPANDFAAQEPGSNDEIQAFCTTNFEVQFPLYSKIAVTGPNKHPLYKHLTTEKPDTENRQGMEANLRGHKIEPTPKPEVVWNFEKFLINRQGRVVRRFAPDTTPDAPKLVEAIEAELAKV